MSAETPATITGVCLALLTACVAALPAQAIAAEDMPDMALLEYLGSWEGTDEDWVLLNDDERPANEEAEGDSNRDSVESQESDDER
ncbi:MAG: hypothetical protein WBM54_12825 [Woeseia sp.]